MPALVAGIHVFLFCGAPGRTAWMAGTSPAMTAEGSTLYLRPSGAVAAASQARVSSATSGDSASRTSA